MRNEVKKLLGIFAIALLAICMCGCAAEDKKNTQDTSETENSIENMISIDLYYVDSEWEDYVIRQYDLDQLASPENMLDSVMVKLLTTEQESNVKTPVPSGMTYQRYRYDGKGTVTVVFNMDYENISTYEQLICKAAFTNTLCQLGVVEYVTFEMVNLINEDDIKSETYSMKDFTRLRNVLASEYTAEIYCPASDGERLVSQYVTLDMSDKESLEQQIIDELRNAAAYGLVNPFSDEARINYINVTDRICYVDVNDKFLKGKTGIDNKVIIYSIVNSLVSIEYIDAVRFTVDGNDAEQMEDMNLSVVYRGNYSFSD